jgi:hypothetical protein
MIEWPICSGEPEAIETVAIPGHGADCAASLMVSATKAVVFDFVNLAGTARSHDANSSNNAFASFRSRVSNPSNTERISAADATEGMPKSRDAPAPTTISKRFLFKNGLLDATTIVLSGPRRTDRQSGLS